MTNAGFAKLGLALAKEAKREYPSALIFAREALEITTRLGMRKETEEMSQLLARLKQVIS